jgi:hypothetical protein
LWQGARSRKIRTRQRSRSAVSVTTFGKTRQRSRSAVSDTTFGKECLKIWWALLGAGTFVLSAIAFGKEKLKMPTFISVRWYHLLVSLDTVLPANQDCRTVQSWLAQRFSWNPQFP